MRVAVGALRTLRASGHFGFFFFLSLCFCCSWLAFDRRSCTLNRIQLLYALLQFFIIFRCDRKHESSKASPLNDHERAARDAVGGERIQTKL